MAKRAVGKNLQKLTDEHIALMNRNAKNAESRRRSAVFEKIAGNAINNILPNESDDINDDPDEKD